MNTWTESHEVYNSDWVVFTKDVEKDITYGSEKDGTTVKEKFTVLLEEVSKNWSHPHNWRVTLTRHQGDKKEVVLTETFYLNVDSWSHEAAMKRTKEIVDSYNGSKVRLICSEECKNQ